MPILKAKAEAEALCAQLNSEGQVDACITADSDAFLFGAHCVVKLIRPNSKVSASSLWATFLSKNHLYWSMIFLTQHFHELNLAERFLFILFCVLVTVSLPFSRLLFV